MEAVRHTAAAERVSPWSGDEAADRFSCYLNALNLLERLHRQLLDVIKDELDRTGRNDLNSVQALVLFSVGETETTAGELRTRGYYQGSNISYTLKKLVDSGYLHHKRSTADKRSVRVSLTKEGQEVNEMLIALFERHLDSLREAGGISDTDLASLNVTLRRLERFWLDQILYRL